MVGAQNNYYKILKYTEEAGLPLLLADRCPFALSAVDMYDFNEEGFHEDGDVIREKLKNNAFPETCKIFGAPGIGKTHQAIKYLITKKKTYCSIIWLQGDMDLIPQLQELVKNHMGGNGEDYILQLNRLKGRHLVIIDGISSEEQLRRITCLGRKLRPADYLITGAIETELLGSVVPIENLNAEDSQEFIKRFYQYLCHQCKQPFTDEIFADFLRAAGQVAQCEGNPRRLKLWVLDKFSVVHKHKTWPVSWGSFLKMLVNPAQNKTIIDQCNDFITLGQEHYFLTLDETGNPHLPKSVEPDALRL